MTESIRLYNWKQDCPIGGMMALESAEPQVEREGHLFALVVDSDEYEIRTQTIGVGIVSVCDEWRAKLNLYERIK